jgi:hypothetical protein
MAKATITKIWITGLILLVVGLIVGGLGLGLLFAYGGEFVPTSTPNDYTFVPRIDAFFWAMVSLMAVGFAVAAAGGVAQIAAWIGALINTQRLQDNTWFIVLLVGGVLGLAFSPVGFAVMVAYVVAGPDGMAAEHPPLSASAPPPTVAPTS